MMIKLPVRMSEAFGSSENSFLLDADDKFVSYEAIAAALNADHDLRQAVARENDEICQILGKALGYPWFKDDQKNFPGADESSGVCVGEHVAVTLAMEAARALNAAPKLAFVGLTVEALGEMLSEAGEELGDPPGDQFARSAWIAAYDAAILSRLQAFASPQTPQWQPIETAPRDGRPLLLGYSNQAGKWRTTRGEWMSADYIEQWFDEPSEPGWFETAVEIEDVRSIQPTHWMPLPAAPEAQGGPDHG